MDESISKFENYRQIIEHEDNLINHRVSWLLIAQSFLLGACVASGKYPFIIIFFGFISTLISYLSIRAALSALKILKDEVYETPELMEHKPKTISTDSISSLGDFGAKYLPISFLAIWGVLAFFPWLGTEEYSIWRGITQLFI